MSLHKTTRLAVGAIVLSALAACGSQSPGGSSPTTPGTPTASTPGNTSTALDPVGLVGLWRVEDASGVPAGEYRVILNDEQLTSRRIRLKSPIPVVKLDEDTTTLPTILFEPSLDVEPSIGK